MAESPRHRLECKLLWAAVLVLSALLPWWGAAPAAAPSTTSSPEWPREWNGRPLRPMSLSDVEERFAQRFPGHIVRLTDGENVLVVREVRAATRMLHPAADCYRGLGYEVTDARLERDGEQRLWRCFVAERNGQRVRVCERIVDAQGLAHTDTSGWFWAAALGHSTGPWQAITIARPL
ncbi:hypothetical protein M8A51_19430 [Schlegelella sp. S2-27]|uniref:Uncharacterized protein n=1 Tax=Caldimonas mangrovi TaxID=2944811 RepID=A0ABT0YTI2_9BURK|nr:hypothetical protein [Caldimonas mangrovi]MCM5681704.1 hypothetical protein [Caldimonas mangrovi]